MTFDVARAQPLRAMVSGPVGGTVAAAHIAAPAGYKNVVASDMGGATATVSLVITLAQPSVRNTSPSPLCETAGP